MTFSHRLTLLAAVVTIPIGIAAASELLADEPAAPRIPREAELKPPDASEPSARPERSEPSAEVAPRPPVSDAPVPDAPDGLPHDDDADDDFDDDTDDDDFDDDADD